MALFAALGDDPSGPFIKGTPTFKGSNATKFVKQLLGKNLLYCIGKDVVTKLGLENPET